jgi:hypothetical protein
MKSSGGMLKKSFWIPLSQKPAAKDSGQLASLSSHSPVGAAVGEEDGTPVETTDGGSDGAYVEHIPTRNPHVPGQDSIKDDAGISKIPLLSPFSQRPSSR